MLSHLNFTNHQDKVDLTILIHTLNHTYREVNPNTNRVDFRVQIQMRFCVLDVSTRQPDCFPNTICAKVNGVVAQLPVSVLSFGLFYGVNISKLPHLEVL